MIIKESVDKKNILYEPETIKERSFLETFPGFFREGLYFFTPCKQNIVYNIYGRIRKKTSNIKYTPFVKELIEGEMPIKHLPEDFVFHTKPLQHQLIALRFAYTFESIGLLLEPGLGKTKVVLDYIYLKKFKRSLVICPLALLHVWKDEVEKHRPELKVHLIEETDWESQSSDIKEADLVVINYTKAVILEDYIKALAFPFVAVDEGLIKNPSTDRTKSITSIGYTSQSRMIMSGTLVNNSPLDVFAPVRFIEPSLIGKRWTDFKNRYTVTSRKNKNIILGVHDVPEIKSILHACSIVMTKEEWLKDLPPKRFHKKMVQMGDTQRALYVQLASNYLAIMEDGTEVEVSNALSLMSKLYQLANGFVYISEDQDEEVWEDLSLEVKLPKVKKKPRRTVVFEQQPKIDAMLQLMEDPDGLKGRRAIVWFNMAAECDIIEKALKEKGDSFLTIRGGDKELGTKVRRFNKDPSVRWLICQAKTINYGQTIMGDQEEWQGEVYPEFDPKVSDEIFYSMNFSLEMFLQQQDRIHRIGQTEDCDYWILMTNCSVEKKTVARIEEKQICSREILEDIAKTARFDFVE